VSKNAHVCGRVTGDNDGGTVVLDLTMVDYIVFYRAVISVDIQMNLINEIEWDIAFPFSVNILTS